MRTNLLLSQVLVKDHPVSFPEESHLVSRGRIEESARAGRSGGRRRGTIGGRRGGRKEELELTIKDEEFRSTPVSDDVQISTPLSTIPLRIYVEKSLRDFQSHLFRVVGGGGWKKKERAAKGSS